MTPDDKARAEAERAVLLAVAQESAAHTFDAPSVMWDGKCGTCKTSSGSNAKRRVR